MNLDRSTAAVRFLDTLRTLAGFCEAAVEPLQIDRGWMIRFSPNFPMSIRVDMNEEGLVALTGIVHVHGLVGDKSDYHELISVLWALTLRVTGTCSVRLIDVPHPIIQTELGQRLIIFEQPTIMYFSVTEPPAQSLWDVIAASATAARLFSLVYRDCGGDVTKEKQTLDTAWMAKIIKALSFKRPGRYDRSTVRQYPTWTYFRREDRVAAFSFETDLFSKLLELCEDGPSEDVTAMNINDNYLIRSEGFCHSISKKTIVTLTRLMEPFGLPKLKNSSVIMAGPSFRVVPTESHVILVTRKGFAIVRSDSGQRQFGIIRASALERHRNESRLLNADVLFRWASQIDDEQFEALILDLIRVEGGVSWARQVGATNAQDAGRDLIATWFLGPAAWQHSASPDERRGSMVNRRVIIQCKTTARGGINLSSVSDIPQILDLHDATGYLLVAFPRITPQVVDYMTRVPLSRGFWADWWTKVEIEARLRANLPIAKKYPSLVSWNDVSPGANLSTK